MDVVHSDENDEGEDMYLFLDFNGKISNEVFENEVFLRIANLHKRNPLVQINDSVYKGTYDYSIGTNMFFEEVEDAPSDSNPFEKQTLIHLKHVVNTTKVVSLKQVKIPQGKVDIPNETKNIAFNLDWDYKTLLDKFENGTLELQDIIKTDEGKTETKEQDDEPVEMAAEEMKITVDESHYFEMDKKIESLEESNEAVKMLGEEYQKLSILARRPVKRPASPEVVAECDEQYKDAYEYHNIEREILKPCDAFRTENITCINEATLSDCVDIDRCVLCGLIPSSFDYPRILSVEEKQKLLTLENFENLSLAARYYVLNKHVQSLEKHMQNISKDKLEVKDEYGHTPVQTLQIYKRLSEAVKKRLGEIKASYDTEIER